jgi:uncharacterized membrane protein
MANGQSSYLWHMKRNCSFTPRQVGLFYLSMVCFSSLIASYFWWHGAWMILPFTFAELFVLGVALLIYARHASDYEKIKLSGTELTVELFLGNRRTVKHWNAPWVRVKDPELNLDAKKQLVVLEMGQEAIQIGQFIVADQRLGLAKEIRSAINRALH